mmetsp:Transcript_54117/g.125887  ORF Transcript_54117/g.125887 Transcript_54117/m.125887 type:complete len:346 (-) Transcript_54117:174-1211(-)|eukprot:CAMPEP_0171102404 /NCGR_PEP_ID=MMETSP0766_2-20121228/57711_1 /TAXON_ID=439317 /ORGANISM="Gambierdiscus australes, Strain CAWD 149" /LENGTH=345 /DNA_ID=CAMNT_0011562695 /DNA_START=83 /DNA_END=1120 /DNA_ORIENTATION=-
MPPQQTDHLLEAPTGQSSSDAEATRPGSCCTVSLLVVSLVLAAICGCLVVWLAVDTPPKPSVRHPEGPVKPDPGAIGWKTNGEVVARGHWCQVGVPARDWTPRRCKPAATKQQIRVLSYNLFWWNLFLQRQGNNASAGHLIAAAARSKPFDVMGFQECNDVGRVLRDAKEAGMQGSFRTVGPVNPVAGAVAIAWREPTWQTLNFGLVDVAEDSKQEWWGIRFVAFARLKHTQSGATIFFMNHHGPLPVQAPGGLCGADGTAYNLLKVVGFHAQYGDAIVLLGDFNAGKDSSTIKHLSQYLDHAYNGNVFGGVDNMFSTCLTALERKNLGNGGSDHDALSVVFEIQ